MSKQRRVWVSMRASILYSVTCIHAVIRLDSEQSFVRSSLLHLLFKPNAVWSYAIFLRVVSTSSTHSTQCVTRGISNYVYKGLSPLEIPSSIRLLVVEDLVRSASTSYGSSSILLLRRLTRLLRNSEFAGPVGVSDLPNQRLC